MTDSTPVKTATVADRVFERPLYKNVIRGFGALAVVVLNVSLVGSDLTQIQAHQRINLMLEALTYITVLIFDFAILRQIIFEVRRVSFWDDKVVLDTLFWRTALRWDEIIAFRKSKFMSTVTIQTSRVVYILNRKDFPQGAELVAKLEGKIGVEPKSA